MGSSFINGGYSITPANDWTTVDSDGSLRMAQWNKTDGTGVCPIGFRVPTLTELKTETLNNGVINSETAFSNFLRFPISGYRYGIGGSPQAQGWYADVWTSSVDGITSQSVTFGSSYAGGSSSIRASGYVVRCIQGN